MSPIPTTPDPRTVQLYSSPLWARPTVWAALGALVTAGAAIAIAWVSPISLPEKITATATALTGLFAALGTLYARQAGIDSTAALHERVIGPPDAPQDLFPPGTVP
jgi:hypothetical protein